VKRRFVILPVLVCALIFASCAAEDPGHDILNPYFTGRVIEKYENNCLLEVTDIGNGNFFVGERLIVTTDISKKPIQVALNMFRGLNLTVWGYMGAGMTMAILPLVILFLCCQKQFIGGLQAGALKG
jgi:hypothetical protein